MCRRCPRSNASLAERADNPDDWASLPWRNLYDSDGPTYRITTHPDALGEPDVAIVKRYADVLRDYRVCPEHKFHSPDGQPCGFLTARVLQRRPVHLAGGARHIGKEAYRLDDVQTGLVGDLAEVLTEYDDPTVDLLHQLVLPVLDRYSGRQLTNLLATDRRTIDRTRQGQTSRPQP